MIWTKGVFWGERRKCLIHILLFLFLIYTYLKNELIIERTEEGNENKIIWSDNKKLTVGQLRRVQSLNDIHSA